jgi:hypothetical protein
MGARNGFLAALGAWLTPDSSGNIAHGAPPAAGDNSNKLTTTGWFKAEQATETVQGTAKVATQAITNAGTDDTTIVTPKKLRAGFAISLGSSGYIAFPTWLGGLIIQWSNITSGTGGLVQAAFPIAFPTAMLAAIANYIEAGNGLGVVATVSSNTTKSIIQVNCFTTSTGAGLSGGAIYYIAFGF